MSQDFFGAFHQPHGSSHTLTYGREHWGFPTESMAMQEEPVDWCWLEIPTICKAWISPKHMAWTMVLTYLIRTSIDLGSWRSPEEISAVARWLGSNIAMETSMRAVLWREQPMVKVGISRWKITSRRQKKYELLVAWAFKAIGPQLISVRYHWEMFEVEYI